MLDINMPKMDGLEVARHIRILNQDIPIIMLTAYTESTLLLDAIDLNITKYLVKPVSKNKLKEVLLEISKKLEKHTTCLIKLAEGCHWHQIEHNLYYNDVKVDLTPKEKSLLVLLTQKYQKNISIEEIITHVWENQYMEEISFDTVKKLVSNLRKKLPDNCLKSVYGSGYILQ
jgi:DNA-binding response OmpR family regulator